MASLPDGLRINVYEVDSIRNAILLMEKVQIQTLFRLQHKLYEASKENNQKKSLKFHLFTIACSMVRRKILFPFQK